MTNPAPYQNPVRRATPWRKLYYTLTAMLSLWIAMLTVPRILNGAPSSERIRYTLPLVGICMALFFASLFARFLASRSRESDAAPKATDRPMIWLHRVVNGLVLLGLALVLINFRDPLAPAVMRFPVSITELAYAALLSLIVPLMAIRLRQSLVKLGVPIIPVEKIGVTNWAIAILPTMAVAVFAFVRLSPVFAVLYFFYVGFISMAAVWAYAVDKRVAVRNGADDSGGEKAQSRIRENALHLLELLGGWPGAWLGQRCLRHKNKKLSFQIVFWIMVVLHLSIIVGLSLLFSLNWGTEGGAA